MLEEVGFIGSGVMLIRLLFMMRRALKAGLVPLTAFFGTLIVGFGEAVFFSPGGMGLLVILLFGWSADQLPLRRRV